MSSKSEIDETIKIIKQPDLLVGQAYPNTVTRQIAETITSYPDNGGAWEGMEGEIKYLRKVVATLIIRMHGRAALNDDDLKVILGGGSYPEF